jgi:hypothetical protein
LLDECLLLRDDRLQLLDLRFELLNLRRLATDNVVTRCYIVG